MLIITIVFGSTMTGIKSFIETTRVSNTKKDLQIIRESIIGFAIENGRMPCPASKICGSDSRYHSDGREDWSPEASICDEVWGLVPSVTLGVNAKDPWDNLYMYRIGDGANGYNKPIHIGTKGNIYINNDVGPESTTIATNIAAVIYSIGANQGRGWNSESNGPSAVEAENYSIDCNNTVLAEDNTLVYKDFVPPDSNMDEYDDVMLWMSGFYIKARLSQAGVL